MQSYIRRAAELLAPHVGQSPDAVCATIAPPPKPEMGDFGFPCFALAKERKLPPPRIAAELASALGTPAPFASVSAAGPFLNFTVDRPTLVREVHDAIRVSPIPYGSGSEGAGRTVLIDYSSPNIAKPLAIHHIRSTILGAALVRLYRYRGYAVVGINHLGDWGTNFGQLMVSYKRQEAARPGQAVDIHSLLQMYIQFHREAEGDETLNDEAKAWFVKLEEGDAEAVRLWKLFCDESLRSFRRLYERLGVEFEEYIGESFYNGLMEATLARLAERGLSKESEGALVVPLDDEGMPPCLLRKRDGSTLYATRDLAAAEYRYGRWRFDRCLYVVALQQELHFRQLFAVLRKMGHAWAEDCRHVRFGMLGFGPGVFDDGGAGTVAKRMTGSTRKGAIVFLEDVLDKAAEKAAALVRESARDDEVLRDIDTLSETIGVGAVVFNELSQRRIKDVVFTWERALNLHGDSGPYLQYTHARLSSVLRRYGRELPASPDLSPLGSELEIEVVKRLAAFPEAVERAVAEDEPSQVSDCLLDLAGCFNRFFTDKSQHRIVSEDEAVTAARVALADCVRRVLATGLALLGIAAPERM